MTVSDIGVQTTGVRVETDDVSAFVDRGQPYVSGLQAVFDTVAGLRSRTLAAIGADGTPPPLVARLDGGTDPLAELMAEARIANVFCGEIVAALGSGSGVDSALSAAGLDGIGSDLSLEGDRELLATIDARHELREVIDEAADGTPEQFRLNAVGFAVEDWLASLDARDPAQRDVAAGALVTEGVARQAALDAEAAAGADGAVAGLLVTQGLLRWSGDSGELTDTLAAQNLEGPDGPRTALQLVVDALDLDQTNSYLNVYAPISGDWQLGHQPSVRTQVLGWLVDGTIETDGTIGASGQELVDDILDRYPGVVELSGSVLHDNNFDPPGTGGWAWSDEPLVAVLGRALAAPNYGLTDDDVDAAARLESLDWHLARTEDQLTFNRLLAQRVALTEELAGGDADVALLIDGAMAQGLSAAEAVRLARYGHDADGPNGTDARVRRLRLVHPTTGWGDPVSAADAAAQQGFDQAVARSIGVELGALQSIQSTRYQQDREVPTAPLSPEQVDLVQRYAEVETWFHHRLAGAWPGPTEEAVAYVASLDPDELARILIDPPDGFDELLTELDDSSNAEVWRHLEGAGDNDTFLGPDGRFNPPTDRVGNRGDAQALLVQLALLSAVGPHHDRLDIDQDGTLHEDEVSAWLEANDGRDGVPPSLVDQIRTGGTYGLGQDTFWWEEIGETIGWIGIAAAAGATIAYSGGGAVPLWVKAGLVGLAGAEAVALHQGNDNVGAILAGAAWFGDLADAAKLLRQARNIPPGAPTAAADTLALRSQLEDLARGSELVELKRLADGADELSDEDFLDRFEVVAGQLLSADLSQGMANGATLSELLAALRFEAGADLSLLIRTAGAEASTSAVQADRLRNQLTAWEIAGGHAYSKHVVQRREFPGVRTRAEFAAVVETVLNHYSDMASLSGGRTAYWRDGVVVIVNPSAIDGGTAFAPTDGFDYFERLN